MRDGYRYIPFGLNVWIWYASCNEAMMALRSLAFWIRSSTCKISKLLFQTKEKLSYRVIMILYNTCIACVYKYMCMFIFFIRETQNFARRNSLRLHLLSLSAFIDDHYRNANYMYNILIFVFGVFQSVGHTCTFLPSV